MISAQFRDNASCLPYEYSITVSYKPQNMVWGRVGVKLVHDELIKKTMWSLLIGQYNRLMIQFSGLTRWTPPGIEASPDGLLVSTRIKAIGLAIFPKKIV